MCLCEGSVPKSLSAHTHTHIRSTQYYVNVWYTLQKSLGVLDPHLCCQMPLQDNVHWHYLALYNTQINIDPLSHSHMHTHTVRSHTDWHSLYRSLRSFNDPRVPEHKGWNMQRRSRMFINGGDLFHQDFDALRFCFPLRVNCRAFIWHSTPAPFIIWYSFQHNCFFSAKNDSSFVSHTFSVVYFLSCFLSFSPSGRVQINFFPHLP